MNRTGVHASYHHHHSIGWGRSSSSTRVSQHPYGRMNAVTWGEMLVRKPQPMYPPPVRSATSTSGQRAFPVGQQNHPHPHQVLQQQQQQPSQQQQKERFNAINYFNGGQAHGAGAKIRTGQHVSPYVSHYNFLVAHASHHHHKFAQQHGKKLFRCPQCRYVTDRKNNLKRHIGTMHQDCGKVLECCDVVFPSKASLRDHVMLFHRTGYKCRYCARNFCRKALLKRHLLVHTGHRDFVCTICDYGSNSREEMDRHKKAHQVRIQTSQSNMYWMLGGVDLNGESWLKSYPALGQKIHANLFDKRLKETHGDVDGGQGTKSESDTDNLREILDKNCNSCIVKKINSENCTTDCTVKKLLSNSNSPQSIIEDKLQPQVPAGQLHQTVICKVNSSYRLCAVPYKCAECSRTFPKQSELITHAQNCRKCLPEPARPLKACLPRDHVINIQSENMNRTGDFVDTMKLLNAMGLDEENDEEDVLDLTISEKSSEQCFSSIYPANHMDFRSYSR